MSFSWRAKLALGILTGCLAAGVLWAQNEPAPLRQEGDEDLVIRSETRLVVLHTTVSDKNNLLMTDLLEDSFRVFENDQLQTLKLFRREDVPVSLGILVDNSGSMLDKRLKVNTAALDFVKASNPEDEVFIVNFNDEAFLDTPFTADLPRLQDGLQRIDSRGGTALYDAVGMSLDHLEDEAKQDKRVLLIITDGEDNASRSTLERLVRRLQETDTVIYAVGLLSEEDRRSAKRAQRAIRAIVRETGGAAFFPDSVDEVHAITQQVARDIRNQYILAYSPADSAAAGFRRVRIELTGKAKRYKVRHRPGYYAQ
ncbi:MAG: VWA domain-containing protein [Acidobacteria bacterium]|nr:VWA domain-containing protein [Acidobacteriota bacterium]